MVAIIYYWCSRTTHNPLPVSNMSSYALSGFVVSSKAMSGGGEFITETSLFAFDDAFGDGSNCLLAGSVLYALSVTGVYDIIAFDSLP